MQNTNGITQTNNLLDSLNKEQKAAALCVEGPVLVFAGAGSGKTRTLTYRIAHMVLDCGIFPDHILAITFTNKATEEMALRLNQILGDEAAGLTISTIHGLCARILRKDATQLGYARGFNILDTEDQLKVIGELYDEHQIDKANFKPKTVLKEIAYTKSHNLSTPEDVRLADLFEWYNEKMMLENNMDFEDLLLNVNKLFQEYPETLRYYQERYSYILVDEFQDTSTVQYDIVQAMALSSRNLFVVGDDDQSIYSFRGTDYANMQKLKNDFPEIQVFYLTENYRSSEEILKKCNALIKHNDNREEKELFSKRVGEKTDVMRLCYDNEKQDASDVALRCNHILEENPDATIAVLYRSNSLSRNYEHEMVSYHIPYKLYGGIPYLRRAEVKDMIAYLKLISGNHDIYSLKRIINTPRRHIGPKTVDIIVNFMTKHKVGVTEALIGVESMVSSNTYAMITKFREFLDKEREEINSGISLVSYYEGLLERLNYKAYLDDNMDNEEERWENLLEFKSLLVEQDQNLYMPLEDKLENIFDQSALDSAYGPRNAKEGGVVLSTIHSVKGLEFDVVFVVGLEEGVFPQNVVFITKEELEEERRIAYVAFTRAKNQLYLCNDRMRMLYGRTERRIVSRFVTECFPEVKTEKALPRKTFNNAFSDFDFNQALEESRQKQKEEKEEKPVVKKEVSGYHPADKVIHEIFGEGTIIAIEGNMLTIFFMGLGEVKHIDASFPKLHKKE